MWIEILAIVIILFVVNKYFRGARFLGKKPDLNGYVAVITGGNTGIGKQTALDLVKQGCYVIIGARDTKKSQKAVGQIMKAARSDKIEQHSLDLSSKESIKNFVNKINQQKVDFLINNAGVMSFPKRTLSKDGFQMQYAVNHLGHAYLTSLLMDKLKKSNQFRIINVSSLGHKAQGGIFGVPKVNFDDMNFEKTKYSPTLSYSLSKLYNVLFTKALAERIPENKGVAYSLHPGAVRTQLTRYLLPGALSYILVVIYPLYFLFTKSSYEGAQTTLHLVYTPKLSLKNGDYYADCAPSKMSKQVKKQNWDQLWEITERDLGVDLSI